MYSQPALRDVGEDFFYRPVGNRAPDPEFSCLIDTGDRAVRAGRAFLPTYTGDIDHCLTFEPTSQLGLDQVGLELGRAETHAGGGPGRHEQKRVEIGVATQAG